MPLNFDLIKQATAYSLERLNYRIPTPSSKLHFLESFIDPELSNKLLSFIQTDDILWSPEKDQNYQTRGKLNWVFDSVIEEAHIVLENLTDKINELYQREVYFQGISVWRDIYPYTIETHRDNPEINIAVQIYLSGNGSELGTKFNYDNQVIQTPYTKDSGYIQDNTDDRTNHYFDSTIPPDHTRYSLYAIWGKHKKSV
jgi:hypothetical protein